MLHPGRPEGDIIKHQLTPETAAEVAFEYGIAILHREKPDF